MAKPTTDIHSEKRKEQDERIAAEPQLGVPELSADAAPKPLESHLVRRRPLAIAGVVENGLIRPLDPAIKLPEHSRVIIVATG